MLTQLRLVESQGFSSLPVKLRGAQDRPETLHATVVEKLEEERESDKWVYYLMAAELIKYCNF